METLFTWLHLSDLCLRSPREDGGAPAEQLLAALGEDVEQLGADPFDAVLVTGDLAATGQPEEYAAADALLVGAAHAVHLGPERVYLVPGNHDVDRSADRSPLTGKLVAELRQGRRRFDAALEHARAREVLSARLRPFAVFAGTFGPPPADDDAPPEELLWWSHRVEGRGGLKVRIVGLCTAFLADGDADRGVLRLGERQLADVAGTIKPGELVVAMTHHPARGGWLADEHDADAWLRRYAHVHVTGHPHDPIAEEARAGVAGPYVWVAAGSSPPRRKGAERRLGYAACSIVQRPDGAMEVHIAPRRWSPEAAGFVRDERFLPRDEIGSVRRLALTLAAHSAPPAPRDPTPPPPPVRVPAPAAQRSPSTPPPPVIAAARPGAIGPRAITPPARAATPGAPRVFEGPGAMPAVPVPLFEDRTGEVAAIVAAFEEPSVAAVLLTGPGGVGKTALAQQIVATRAASMFEESAWIDARDLEAEVGRLLKRFGVKVARTDDPVQALRAALSPRRVLLVIDNVSSGVAGVRALPVLAGGRARTLITSRIVSLNEDLGRGVRSVHVGGFPDAVARSFLRALVPGHAPDRGHAADRDEALDALALRVEGLPLGLRLLGRRLARPDVTPESLAEAFDRDPLGTLDGAAREGESTVLSTFAPAFEALPGALQTALLALAVCAPSTRARTVAHVAGEREDDIAMTLEGLADQSLVEHVHGDDRPFRLHPVVRAFLRGRPAASALESAHDGWVLGHTLAHGEAQAWDEIEAELPEILGMIDRRLGRGDTQGAWDLLRAVIGALSLRDRYAEILDVARRIHAASPEDSAHAVAALCEIGKTQTTLGDLGAAMQSLGDALMLAEASGYQESEALALAGLGRAHGGLGDLEKAGAYHLRAAALHQQLGKRRHHAADMAAVGLVSRRAGNIGDAIEYFERALAAYDELGDIEGRAEALAGLGLCFRDIGELDSAVESFRQALAIHEQLGRRAGQATMLGNLGNTYRTLGELDAAIEHLDRALSIYEDLGLLEGQGAALGNLGACYRALNEAPRALDHYERALAVLRRVGLPDDHPHVRAVLAGLAHARGATTGTRGVPSPRR
jgi:tetratricopeptide (TPR) repeat protein